MNRELSRAARHWEWQYLDLMRHIWERGDERIDRTGVGTRSVFGPQLRFDLSGGRVPLLTTKRVYWKAAAREMKSRKDGERRTSMRSDRRSDLAGMANSLKPIVRYFTGRSQALGELGRSRFISGG